MNYAMWGKALKTVVRVDKTEWDGLDVISRWLIASRASVIIMTLFSAGLAGIFAVRDEYFTPVTWLIFAAGLCLAHASNNIFNDYTDYIKGVDKDNYFRNMYGTQAVAAGYITKQKLLLYGVVTLILGLIAGVYLVLNNGNDVVIWYLIGAGVFCILFYTWPLKYLGLGELTVLVVWGPLMIGGGYYLFSHQWDWNVTLATLPYVLGVTNVLFGKHIDKIDLDKAKKVYTFPVLIGEKAARFTSIGLLALAYALTIYMVAIGYYTPIMLLVFINIPLFIKTSKLFLRPKPTEKPDPSLGDTRAWPLWFVRSAFTYNRKFGSVFITALLLDTALKLFILK